MSVLDKLAARLSDAPTLHDELVALAGGGNAAHENRDKRGRFAPGEIGGAPAASGGAASGKTSAPGKAPAKRGDKVTHGGTEHTVTGTRKVEDGHHVYTDKGAQIHVKHGQTVSQGTNLRAKPGGGNIRRSATGNPANHDPGEIMKNDARRAAAKSGPSSGPSSAPSSTPKTPYDAYKARHGSEPTTEHMAGFVRNNPDVMDRTGHRVKAGESKSIGGGFHAAKSREGRVQVFKDKAAADRHAGK